MTPLVLLPGMDGSSQLFAPLIKALAPQVADIRTLKYPSDELLGYDELIYWTLQQLPQDVPYNLLAESFSGPIAYNIAKTQPKHLKKVIFAATFLQPPRALLPSLAAKLPWKALKRFRLADSLTRRLLLGKNADSDLIEQFWQVIDELPAELIAFRLKQMAQLTVPNVKLSQPCLYLDAAQDFLIGRKHPSLFHRLCPDLQIATIQGPHFIVQAQPDDCAKYISTFITPSQ